MSDLEDSMIDLEVRCSLGSPMAGLSNQKVNATLLLATYGL